MKRNQFNQPIGNDLKMNEGAKFPERSILQGRYGSLVRLSESHIDDLYVILCNEEEDLNWTYLYDGPFSRKEDFKEYINRLIHDSNQVVYTILENENKMPLGIIALMRIQQEHASIEVGNVHYSNALKHTRIATEVQYLLAKYVFEDLGYRRYEWKCDSLNAPSKHAAQRLGFTFEGVFRQSNIYKGRNRDTSWFSMLDIEWPEHKERFEKWLRPDNFDKQGRQITRL